MELNRGQDGRDVEREPTLSARGGGGAAELRSQVVTRGLQCSMRCGRCSIFASLCLVQSPHAVLSTFWRQQPYRSTAVSSFLVGVSSRQRGGGTLIVRRLWKRRQPSLSLAFREFYSTLSLEGTRKTRQVGLCRESCVPRAWSVVRPCRRPVKSRAFPRRTWPAVSCVSPHTNGYIIQRVLLRGNLAQPDLGVTKELPLRTHCIAPRSGGPPCASTGTRCTLNRFTPRLKYLQLIFFPFCPGSWQREQDQKDAAAYGSRRALSPQVIMLHRTDMVKVRRPNSPKPEPTKTWFPCTEVCNVPWCSEVPPSPPDSGIH